MPKFRAERTPGKPEQEVKKERTAKELATTLDWFIQQTIIPDTLTPEH